MTVTLLRVFNGVSGLLVLPFYYIHSNTDIFYELQIGLQMIQDDPYH